MTRRRIGSGFAAVAATALLAIVAVPGVAQARTGSDARCLGPDRQFLVCTAITPIAGAKTQSIGGPVNPPEPNETAPIDPDEPDQCQPRGTEQTPYGKTLVVGNTQGAEFNSPNGQGNPYWNQNYPWAWEWDYWVDGGGWVLWDGRMSGYFPWNFDTPNHDTGLVSLAASVHNHWAGDSIKARMFWVCFPADTAPEGLDANGNPTFASGLATASDVGTGAPGLRRPGGAGEDEIRGDVGHNPLIGFGGDDELSGGDGEDHLHGGTGDDSLSGGDHADLLHGRSGADAALGGDGGDDILAGKGDDLSKGGDGDDQLFDGNGEDELRGGRGDDRFAAQDGDRDRIVCGPGEDIALIDRFDKATGCEHVYRSAREAPKKPPRI
jgi:hypothetical protein